MNKKVIYLLVIIFAVLFIYLIEDMIYSENDIIDDNNDKYISFLETLDKKCTMIETVTNGSRTPTSETWLCSGKYFKWVTE
jgi:hypothetical protein